ncbi:uncharacterized protein LOC110021266 [Phalaenopsis equestris]|uniref:uncharacterized protein LOC110021266 n=1 Tax=Phalaenopsis equestris TaxID=78828 RepID=UPI0009E4DB79|nr:uncharacterized protein LOC110021266 [Phalaenopsis equestris]
MQNMSSNPPTPDTTSSTRDGGRRRFRVPFVRKINWGSLFRYSKKWAKHPMNIALLFWLFFVAACLVVLFLLMTGILNQTIPKSSVRKKWTEIFNQILNALFTIMCLYQHPRISHHLVLLCHWKPNDILELRKVYCKNGTKKPHERAHIMFVVFLLQITCFSQYGLCALYWAYTSNTRPDWPQILFIALGTGAPIIAALYAVFSPLGRRTESESDEESQRSNNEENELKLYSKSVEVTSPEWAGGLFYCWNDLTVYCLSFFCTFCIFGWNMERLGFGNMYVHIITFILLCSAPLLVFSVTALNINDEAIRDVVGIIGIVLCLFGFLYGGFWRIQMRKRFKLPGNTCCFGFLACTDFMQWLFCWSCSLAQEVRTGNFYDVQNDSFYRNESEDGSQTVINILPCENGAGLVIMSNLESEAGNKCGVEQGKEMEMVKTGRGEDGEAVRDEMMRAPLQTLIKMEEEQPERAIRS